MSFDALVHHCRDIVAATDLTVSADLERGKGDSPESSGETVFAAEAAGLAGCSLEDHTGDADKPIYDFSLAVERVTAAAEAARALMLGGDTAGPVTASILWSLGIIAVMSPIAIAKYRKV